MFVVSFSRLFIGSSPDPYPSDRPGVNYIVTRDLVVDVEGYEQGLIDHQILLSWEIKLGESKDLVQRRHGYVQCQRRYRHEWKVMYTTPEHKLMGEFSPDVGFLVLVQPVFRGSGAR
jgi:hypothetical protein